MNVKRDIKDHFPYEAAYRDFKINEGCLPETVDDYSRKLADFFDDLCQSNEVYNATKDITKITLEDLKIHFEKIRPYYTAGTFNNIHIVLNQYYRFLIVEARLPVPPLTWAIATQKREQIPKVLQLDWETLAQKVLEGNYTEDEKLIFLLFSKGWSTRKMLSSFAGQQLLRFEWTKSERDFLTFFHRPVIGAKHLFLNKKGNPISPDTLTRRLNRVLKQFDLPYKHGVLRDDARIMYIANHNLNGQEIEKLFGFVSEGRFSKLLLKLSDEIRKNKQVSSNNER